MRWLRKARGGRWSGSFSVPLYGLFYFGGAAATGNARRFSQRPPGVEKSLRTPEVVKFVCASLGDPAHLRAAATVLSPFGSFHEVCLASRRVSTRHAGVRGHQCAPTNPRIDLNSMPSPGHFRSSGSRRGTQECGVTKAGKPERQAIAEKGLDRREFQCYICTMMLLLQHTTGGAVLRLSKLAALIGLSALAQSAIDAQAPKFEVVSVKPCTGNEAAVVGGGRGSAGAGGSGTPGRLDLNCRTVLSIIQTAYTSGTPPLPPIEGGPAWITSERYSISAKAEGTPSGATMRGPMLQAILRDRFQLKTHLETREVPAYELTIAKGGPKLKPYQDGDCIDIGWVKPLTKALPLLPPKAEKPVICGANRVKGVTGPDITWDIPGTSLDYFAKTFLGLAFWDRPVINKTGIEGLFDIHLEFVSDESTPGPPGMPHPAPATALPGAPDSISAGPSLFSALQQQLGLKLEPARGPREFLVIESVQRPYAN